jgi:hypothetical protein
MNAVFLLKNGKIKTTDIDRRLPGPSGAVWSEPSEEKEHKS